MIPRIFLAAAFIAPLILTPSAKAASNQCKLARAQEKAALDGYQRCYRAGGVGRACGGLTFPQWNYAYLSARDKADKICRQG